MADESSFFCYPHVNHSLVLLFKDSIGGIAELKGTGPDTHLNACMNQTPNAVG
jgi:hypothetical protein